jgi:hypothetical protein
MRLKGILVLFSFHLARDFCTVNAKKEVDHLFRSNIKADIKTLQMQRLQYTPEQKIRWNNTMNLFNFKKASQLSLNFQKMLVCCSLVASKSSY